MDPVKLNLRVRCILGKPVTYILKAGTAPIEISTGVWPPAYVGTFRSASAQTAPRQTFRTGINSFGGQQPEKYLTTNHVTTD